MISVYSKDTDATGAALLTRTQVRVPNAMLSRFERSVTMEMPGFWDQETDASLAARDEAAGRLAQLFRQLDDIGNNGAEGYSRFAWSDEEAVLRVWFAAQMQRRGFRVEVDAAGNQWAWLGEPSAENPGVTVGSHMDSVPGGGAFDGPLGVLSAIVAFDVLRESGWVPRCPIGIASFHDEEGARFAVACFGSRVLTGILPADRALARTDADGVSVREALDGFAAKLEHVRETQKAGLDCLSEFSEAGIDAALADSHAPKGQAADLEYLKRSAAHIELHVEQGCMQSDLGAPVAVADAIWPHGRWRVDFEGEPNHAGSTPLDRRHDAMLAFARFVQRVREEAAAAPDARATVGRVEVEPNGVNVIAAHVTCWLDCRAAKAQTVAGMVNRLGAWLASSGLEGSGLDGTGLGGNDLEGVTATLTRESWTEATVFSPELRDVLVQAVSARGDDAAAGGAKSYGAQSAAEQSREKKSANSIAMHSAKDPVPANLAATHRITELAPVIGTAAGHDAGILAESGCAAGMLFVRNETGASHTPREYATLADATQGVYAYAAAIRDCAGRVAAGWRPRPVQSER
ncbi:MAG: Zn-dependent hydrolase [Bifidobacterium tibiigranuli]|uniref:Zn-dependent hydrolase n=1 Tax=Bifidobacterium tibiigranuli TaxID=2172043 RepID=UPI0026F13426|nr:Zn-dependent hydrolase [Bifidobacterium tibiigranuli]MCI1673031.1 Zn-dependent hydrolase [Bifidobacterium tibiigranuli]MCI1713131.1 Zn-dependent hydrolase [Bifidobacterium tibiigranuli]MCI1834883.1 Zn-dependent hydrolase [Bifidobacterium tibiigranuli]